MRNDKGFLDVTLREYGRAWLQIHEIEMISELGDETLVRMKSGNEYVVKFSLESFEDKFDLDTLK